MKLKYLSLLLLSSLILPICSYASANNVDGFVSENEITSCDYNPIMSEGLDNFYAVGVKDNYFCLLMSPTGLLPQVSQKWYSGGDYEDKSYVCSTYKSTDDNVAIYVNHDPDNKILGCYKSSSLITFDSSTIGPKDEVLGSFKTTLQGLVSDLVIGFYDYFPLVIVIGIGVLMIFTLRGYIRHASSEIFTLNRKGKKSLSWFQNEDIVNMYSNWKKDRVSKHDINNIVKDTVLPDDPGYYDKDGIRYYTDGDLYTRDLREYETKIYQQGYQELSKNSSEFNHMSSEDQMITLGKYKMQYMDKWRSTHDLDPKKFNV